MRNATLHPRITFTGRRSHVCRPAFHPFDFTLTHDLPALPFPPARMKRKVQPAACATERHRVGIELGGIALLFPVQKSFDIRAFVAAGLEVQHPSGSVRIANQAVDPIATTGAARSAVPNWGHT